MSDESDDIDTPEKAVFRYESKELAEWVETKYKQGDFKDRTHVINTALKRMKEDDTRDPLV